MKQIKYANKAKEEEKKDEKEIKKKSAVREPFKY